VPFVFFVLQNEIFPTVCVCVRVLPILCARRAHSYNIGRAVNLPKCSWYNQEKFRKMGCSASFQRVQTFDPQADTQERIVLKPMSVCFTKDLFPIDSDQDYRLSQRAVWWNLWRLRIENASFQKSSPWMTLCRNDFILVHSVYEWIVFISKHPEHRVIRDL